MSSDNCVAILATTDNMVQDKDNPDILRHDPSVRYRVAMLMGPDDFEWYQENQIWNLGFWMDMCFGTCPVFDSSERAFAEAIALSEQVQTEYGIIELDARKYNFPGW